MKLTVKKREAKKKSELTEIRHEGDIPAVFYCRGKESESITISGTEFRKVLRELKQGHLPTTVFELEIDGKARKALAREIQYHPTTYKVLHVDFQELTEKETIDVNVPVHPVREMDCVGIKLGGFLRQVKRHVRVRCLPKDMPRQFEVDVQPLSIGQARRVKDLEIPKGVTPLVKDAEVLVVIAKK